jgi:hypothetical protein
MQTRISVPERPVDLGLRDPFLPMIGDIEQFRALKWRSELRHRFARLTRPRAVACRGGAFVALRSFEG